MIEHFFETIPSKYLIIASTIAATLMGILAIFVRTKFAKSPVSKKKIVLPPIFMSTGSLMFIFEPFRVPFLQVVEALGVGILFSFILIKTTQFEVVERNIFLKRSKIFPIILFSLLFVRLIAKLILSRTIDVGELGGMFWILAFGMIVPWRIAMLMKYKRMKQDLIIE